jgi:hypothetical protein
LKKLLYVAIASVPLFFSASNVNAMGYTSYHTHNVDHQHYQGTVCSEGETMKYYKVYDHEYLHNYDTNGNFLSESFSRDIFDYNFYVSTGSSC